MNPTMVGILCVLCAAIGFVLGSEVTARGLLDEEERES